MKSRVIRFVKDWTLPISIGLGSAIYLVFSHIHSLDGLTSGLEPFWEMCLPFCTFWVLYVTFCKVDFHKMRPARWHFLVLLAQFLIVAIIVSLTYFLELSSNTRLLMESLLACVIIFAGLAALRPHRQGKGSAFWLSGRGLFCIGLATGLTAGLTGAGGPVLSIPWMVAVGYTPFYAVGSSMFMQLGTILSGSWGNACSGFIDWKILPWVMLAELAGCLVGLQVAKRISSELARKAIGVLCTGLGVFLLLRQILEF